jgi:hypothetical protein
LPAELGHFCSLSAFKNVVKAANLTEWTSMLHYQMCNIL